MNSFKYEQNQAILAELMQQVEITNLEQLSKVARVSGLQIKRLQYGLIYQLSVENLVKLANALQLSIEQLLAKFTQTTTSQPEEFLGQSQDHSSQFWQQEYQKLEQEMKQKTETLKHEFQEGSIQTIESWLIQWPTAVAAIAKNPDLPAERLVPLVKPVQELVANWGLETIAKVGEELPYDPQWHELMSGAVEPGTIVKVRYVGYRQEDKILYKAKVSPIEES